jgi:hypothetical protein
LERDDVSRRHADVLFADGICCGFNYRFLTPPFFRDGRHLQLPVFDASKTGFRIQDSVAKITPNPRRQKRLVSHAPTCAKMTASETGSLASAFFLWIRAQSSSAKLVIKWLAKKFGFWEAG